ncbi:MAG TPA: HNH endonuclease, partial [Anaerolineae bacterium]|nr:HNH endonuclease [Anaerolineae bacterium]
AYCGKSAYGENAELHVDHIRPRGQGGEDVASNLITACQRCNIEKSTSILFNETQLLEEVERRNAEHNIQPTTRVKMRPTGGKDGRPTGNPHSGTGQD